MEERNIVKFKKEKTTLLILDMQNDKVHLKGKYADFGTPKHFQESGTSTKIKALLDKARETKLKVVYVKFGMRDARAKGTSCQILRSPRS